MKISCVIPAYNESQNIIKVVAKVSPLVDEVIIVDDCSSDNTYELAKTTTAIVLRHPINRGQGAALQTGDEYALNHDADIVVHFDADDQFKAEEIKDLIKPIIENKADAVFGSRFLGSANFPYIKRVVIMPLARLINRFFGITLSDPQSGFRALNRQTLSQIKIENRGMAHCSEILYKTFKSGARIVEVPITVTYHEFGQSFGGGFKIIKDLIIHNFIK
ncbi:MAG: glycosyltransferase family 2 protein [Candidatus Falkowbacteria bacterium]